MNEKKEALKVLIEHKISGILSDLGFDSKDSNLEGTPHRIAKMWLDEVFSSAFCDISELDEKMTLFPAPSDKEVVVKDIPFYSMCAHHFMPFFGKAEVRYVPSDKVIGLSKIPRVVKWFSKKPQMQENLTKEIGEYLVGILHPISLKVRLYDTTHTCVTCRGAESEMTTDTEWEM